MKDPLTQTAATSVNSFNCVIVKCLVVHSLGDISRVCLACLVQQNLKQSATTLLIFLIILKLIKF
jgi:hypothetical protein